MSADSPSQERQRPTRWTRRLKKALKRLLLLLANATVPYIYLSYMWLVTKTSKVEERGFTPGMMREQCGDGIWAIWHDECCFVAWSFGKYNPHTLASKGDSGELITRFLQKCSFTVYRGGSSSSHKRRASDILRDMIECTLNTNGVLWGLTVDGSKGPVYRMKPGVVLLSQRCQMVVGVERTWCKRYLRLPTWDRTLIPLPFNHIIHAYTGPFYPPESRAPSAEKRAFRADIEAMLCQMAGYVRREIEGQDPPEDWIQKFPEDYQELVRKGQEPVLLRPVDKDRFQVRVPDSLADPKAGSNTES